MSEQLMSCSNDGTVKIWRNPSTAATSTDLSCLLRTLDGDGSHIFAVEFTDRHTFASAGSLDSSIRIRSLLHPHVSSDQQLLVGHTLPVTCLRRVSADVLASGSTDCTIKLWNLGAANECVRTLTGHEHVVSSLEFLADTHELASASWDASVRVWDVFTGACRHTLRGHTSYVNCVKSLDRHRLASCSDDMSVKIWRPSSDTNYTCEATLTGHTAYVNTLSVLSERVLASGSADKSVKLWDVARGACLRTLVGHEGALSALLAIKRTSSEQTTAASTLPMSQTTGYYLHFNFN